MTPDLFLYNFLLILLEEEQEDPIRYLLFAGPAGVGKSTTASVVDYFFAQQGRPILRISYAWFLKSFLRRELGITKESDPDLYRKLAQKIGTDLLRNEVSEDFHVRKLMDYLENTLNLDSRYPLPWVVIDDVRFPNEVPFFATLFFVVPENEERRKEVLEKIQPHESECYRWLLDLWEAKNIYILYTPQLEELNFNKFLRLARVEPLRAAKIRESEGWKFLQAVVEKGCKVENNETTPARGKGIGVVDGEIPEKLSDSPACALLSREPLEEPKN